jgi:hypothetical protein
MDTRIGRWIAPIAFWKAVGRTDAATQLRGVGHDTSGNICCWLPSHIFMVDVHARRTRRNRLRNYLSCVRGIPI